MCHSLMMMIIMNHQYIYIYIFNLLLMNTTYASHRDALFERGAKPSAQVRSTMVGDIGSKRYLQKRGEALVRSQVRSTSTSEAFNSKLSLESLKNDVK